MINIEEKLVELKNNVISGELKVEELQRVLSQMLLSTNLPGVERSSKKFDNDLELVIYTLNPSNQAEAAAKVIDEVMRYIERVNR
jgi:hypothetical protein